MPTPTLPRTPSLPLTSAWLARHDAASRAARVRLGVSPDVSAVRL